jgi:hypothetical protein
MSKIDDKKPTVDFHEDPVQLPAGMASQADQIARAQAAAAQAKTDTPLNPGMPRPPLQAPATEAPQAPPMLQPRTPPAQAAAPHIGGVGSAYAVNQAVTQGATDGPVSIEQAKQRGLGGYAETAPAPTPPQEDEQEAAQAKELPTEDADVDLGLGFDAEAIRKARTGFMREDRRLEIEARLKPLRLGDLVTQFEIAQDVPVRPGELEYRLRTISEMEHLFCMEYTGRKAGLAAGAMYSDELYNVSRITCTLVALNGALLVDHREEPGTPKMKVNEEKFEAKLAQILAFPTQLVADIGAQATWFNERVNKLIDPEKIKNGS